jgi:hypothetical protein
VFAQLGGTDVRMFPLRSRDARVRDRLKDIAWRRFATVEEELLEIEQHLLAILDKNEGCIH